MNISWNSKSNVQLHFEESSNTRKTSRTYLSQPLALITNPTFQGIPSPFPKFF